jgi:hypothetical protein
VSPDFADKHAKADLWHSQCKLVSGYVPRGCLYRMVIWRSSKLALDCAGEVSEHYLVFFAKRKS